MNKNEFMKELGKKLNKLTAKEKIEILSDYEEHFRIGLSEGKTEEEISGNLGDISSIAEQFGIESKKEKLPKKRNIFTVILIASGMIFFNLVFVVGPYAGAAGILIGLFAAAVGMAAGGIGGIILLIISPVLSTFLNIEINNPLLIIFLSIGISSLGLLFFIGNCYIAKYFVIITAKYVRWNIKVIKN
jgi:uncharacterized membrane protein